MWSLDWFAASELAKAGRHIRRVAWDDRWLAYYQGLWFILMADETKVVTSADFGEDEFNARDWTTAAFNADPCAATPAFNTTPPNYRLWTDAPIFLPPPVPGFSS